MKASGGWAPWFPPGARYSGELMKACIWMGGGRCKRIWVSGGCMKVPFESGGVVRMKVHLLAHGTEQLTCL